MRGTLRVAVLGAAAAALLGSGLISAVADSATSSANYVETSAYTEDGDGHDLQVALASFDAETGAGQACDDPALAYADNVGAASFTTPIDLDADFPSTSQALDDFCLLNAGSSAGQVYVTFQNVLESELGCSNAELEADPDHCGEGLGEIAAALTSGGAVKWGGDCVAPETSEFAVASSFQGLLEPQQTSIVLEPGQRCKVYFGFIVDSEPNLRRAAQTDALQWDIVFTLQDVTAP